MYTLADLVRFTEAKRRSVQLWAEAGAIVADTATERAGAGVHRAFSVDEAMIACVIARFAKRSKIPIGEAVHIGRSVRDILQDGHWRNLLYKAAASENTRVYLARDEHGGMWFFEKLGNEVLSQMNDDNASIDVVYLNGSLKRLRNQF
jgi:hypothetical protein